MNIAIEQINHAASLIAPEIALLATVCVMFLVGPFLVSETGAASNGVRQRWGSLALLAIGVAGMIWYNSVPQEVTMGPFRADALLWYTRGLTLSLGAVLVLVMWNQTSDSHAAEAYACLLSIIAGANLVAAANDLVGVFLGLELVSIPTYVLLYLLRGGRATREATVKYFLLSVFSSALVLYGMSWLYGAIGTTNLAGIADALRANKSTTEPLTLRLALALLVAGLGFRITAVPFHFYAPDVFEGVAQANAAMLSFVPKVVGFVALVRLLPLTGATLSPGLWLPSESAQMLLAILSVVTMFIGNLLALRQKNLQRLLAYSSVANAGYMLVGLAAGNVGTVGGTSAMLFYLACYGFMTLGVFALLRGAGAEHPVVTRDDLRGLSRVQPVNALLLTVCLLSLIGLPPTAGFWGKLNLFFAAWTEGTHTGHWLAALLALNAAIAAWYYLRLIALMFLETDPDAEKRRNKKELVAWLAGVFCTAATVAIFFSPQWLWDVVVRATS
ncbi:MAG TPA: NADH-quinone oxidoreductase subunit N [Lacipirellulaceae bacterium]|jgi:NADH-quinone oxidoreductase subunit N